MRDTKDMTAKCVRVWMREVLEHKGWTANEWATIAGTSPTNITRLLNGGDAVPSCDTIFKLAQVARSMPNFVFGEGEVEPELYLNFCPECGHDLRPLIQQPRPAADGSRQAGHAS